MTDSSLYDQLVEALRNHADLDDDQIKDAGRHGADQGWPGFSYNVDAASFFDQNERLVWQLLCDQAEDLGYTSPMAMMAMFGRSDMTHTYQGFKVLLSWFALEEAGRYLDGD